MKTVVLATSTIVLMMPGPAYAQDTLRNAYGGAANVVTEVATVAGSGGVTTLRATPAGTADSIEPAPVELASEGSQSAGNVKRVGSATPPSGESSAGASSIGASPAPQVKTSALASLPFTGFDALLLLMGGTVLFAVGLGMRRLSQ